jgi:hypothetical protein
MIGSYIVTHSKREKEPQLGLSKQVRGGVSGLSGSRTFGRCSNAGSMRVISSLFELSLV